MSSSAAPAIASIHRLPTAQDERPAELISRVRDRLQSHLRGKRELVELSMAAFLAGGHLLLEGPPGTGKTSLSKAMAMAFGGTFRRIQMTSDLLPSDITGILRLKPGQSEFEFRPGPVFANFLLADELNRTSPKTQGALLEAMAEGTVTVDGRTYPLPNPFFVAATQNPLEFHGVYPFAESQLDRFMLQLHFTTPDRDDELEIYSGSAQATADQANEALILGIESSVRLREIASRIHIEKSVLDYITDLVRGTRSRPEVSHGVSVRGGLQFMAATRALAFVRGRDHVLPQDVRDAAVPALAHRLCFSTGEPDVSTRRQVITDLLERTPAPR